MLEYFSEDTKEQAKYLVDIFKTPYEHDLKELEYFLDEYVLKDLIKNPSPSYPCPNSNNFCEVFNTPNMGKGVRAKHFIQKGTKIGCYLGTLKHESERDDADDWRYDFAYGLKDFYIDGSKCISMMSVLNHSDNPNVNVKFHLHDINNLQEVHIVFIASKNIYQYTELFIDYGDDYWKSASKHGIHKDIKQSLITDFYSIKRKRDDYSDDDSDFLDDPFSPRTFKQRKIAFDFDSFQFQNLNIHEPSFLEIGGM